MKFKDILKSATESPTNVLNGILNDPKNKEECFSRPELKDLIKLKNPELCDSGIHSAIDRLPKIQITDRGRTRLFFGLKDNIKKLKEMLDESK